MKNHTPALVSIILVLTAALIAVSAYAWRLQRKLADLEYDSRALLAVGPGSGPWVRVTRGAFLHPGSPDDPEWRVCVIHRTLQDDAELPEKIKEEVEHARKTALDPNSPINRRH